MMNQLLISTTLMFILFHSTSPAQSPAQSPSQHPAIPVLKPVPAQSPPAKPGPAPGAAEDEPLVKPAPSHKAAPQNLTDILDKAGGFSDFIRLLRNTGVMNQIENQLNSTNALTILAPSNGGFSGLKTGTLNSLTPEQKVQLLQFHIIPNLVSLQNFETLTNPVRTQASNTKDYPLNITTDGSAVNLTTGLVNATISGTVYSDNQLAIYRVDSVLLPLGIFGRPRADSPSPSPAPEAVPAKAKPKPKKEAAVGAAKAGTAAAAAEAEAGTLASAANSTALKPAAKANSTAVAAAVTPAVAVAVDESAGVSLGGSASVSFAVAVIVLGWFV